MDTHAVTTRARERHRARHPEREHGAIIGPRWRFLAEASEILEYEETLTNVVRFAVPRLADSAIVVLLAEDGSLTWGVSEHRDPEKAALVSRLHAYQPHLTTPNNPVAEALRSGKTQFIDAVDDAFLRPVAQDETHLELLRELAATSVIIIPLAARGQVLGSLLLATARDFGRRYVGLGLAIAKGTVEAQGGYIRTESELGRGAASASRCQSRQDEQL